jgi:hypothetical protein
VETLAAIGKALATVRHASGARAWVVGSTRGQEAIRGDLDALLGALDPAPVARATYRSGERVLERARARGAAAPLGGAVALVNPNTGNGALSHEVPFADLDATGAALVDLLAASVFAGSGTQSFYKRVWASGLAYTGGVRLDPDRGQMTLYAERSPDLAQLARMLGEAVKGEPAAPRLVDYTVINSFTSRLGERYERRAEGMAADLADGVTPDRVRAFRKRLLAVRETKGLAEAMHARSAQVLGAVLPQLAPASGPSPAPGAVLFAVGPEAVVGGYEHELISERGDGFALTRIYPRDFWYTGEIAR